MLNCIQLSTVNSNCSLNFLKGRLCENWKVGIHWTRTNFYFYSRLWIENLVQTTKFLLRIEKKEYLTFSFFENIPFKIKQMTRELSKVFSSSKCYFIKYGRNLSSYFKKMLSWIIICCFCFKLLFFYRSFSQIANMKKTVFHWCVYVCWNFFPIV